MGSVLGKARKSEMLVNFYHTKWRYNPEDTHLQPINIFRPSYFESKEIIPKMQNYSLE
jgi:hypothetical protein